jgi:tRNA threonylcarbamoyladenosine biosynthesis protein TsaB
VSGPLVLAVDTTAELGGVALVNAAGTIAESVLRAADGYGESLFGEIGRLLASAGATLHQIDLFASASGPGSFTGVRVGLTAVKGLAAALDKPAVGVSNLRAMASLGAGDLRAPILDARRGEVYGAVYDARGECVQEETVGPLANWLASLPPGVTLVLTGGVPFEGALPPSLPRMHTGRALAAPIGTIALAELAAGRTLHPAMVEANYVRRSDAEMKWTDR